VKTAGIERGYTLISMLVGLLIGVITVGGMLMLYKSLVVVARDVKTQAVQDGEVVASVLGAQVELQEAGFGVSATAGQDLIVIAGATLQTDKSGKGKLAGTAATSYATAVRGNAVVWGYNPTGNSAAPDPAAYRCSGLLLVADPEHAPDVPGAQLFALQPVACDNAQSWNQLSWQSRALTSPESMQDTGQFEALASSCWPYAHSDAASAMQLNYYPEPASASSSFGRGTDPTMADHAAFSVCLPNFRH